jgi:pimeloyl-ACP methyl ester carboxylesterase
MTAASVVLVHGAWHGAWCWDAVTPLLRDAGVAVVAVDLPGHGDDRQPLADLHGDAGKVRSVLDEVEGPVVLVGHSYGGAVITEAGFHPAVERLVYIAAFNLDEGEAVGRAATREADTASIDHSDRPDLGAALRSDDEGRTTTIATEGATEILYNDCSAAIAEWATARLGPQRMANFGDEPKGVAWRDRRSTYVVCTEDQAVHPDLQRILARRATDTVVWPTGHSPFLSQPDLVTRTLRELA